MLSKLFKIYFGIFFIGSFLLLYPLFYFFLKIDVNFHTVFKLKRFWARIIFAILWSRLDIEGMEKIPDNQSFILCPNHTSYLDIIALCLVTDKLFLFMAKAELAKIPVFGIFFRTMNITVNRSSAIHAAKAFIRAKNELKKGNNIALFPEGTISGKAPELIPFKDGAFKLALDCNVPIVSVSFTNNYNIIGEDKSRKLSVKPGRTKAIIGDALYPMQYTDAKALKDATFAQIQYNLSA